VIVAIRGAIGPLTAMVLATCCSPLPTAEEGSARYCLSIAVPLRPQLREEVSVIDLVVENGYVAAIPRFPIGWELKVENQIDNNPVPIFGGATGSVAELRAEDLRCLFEIEKDAPGAPPITVSGKVRISTGIQEREVALSKDQIVLERIMDRQPH
jgi:hypothetical protein